MIAPLIAVVAVGLQVSVPEVGLTVSAYAFAASGTALVVGPLSDARGRRPFLLGAAALLLAVSAITALSSSYAAFLLARTGAGIAGGTISALAVAWVADLTPYRKRGRVMAILLGAAMATAVVGQIGAAFAAGRTGHQPVYGALAAGCALVLLALATLRETAARRPGRSAALGRQFGGYLRFLRHPPLRTAALAAFCMSASLVGVTTYGAGWLQESRGYSVSEVGLMYGALGAAILVTQPLAGPLAGRFGKRRFAIGASIAAGLATVSLPLLSGVGLLAVLLLFGCVAVARMGAFTALRSELAGSDQRERRAHIVRLRDLRCDGLPDAQRLQRRLAVDPGGHRVHERHGEAAPAEHGGDIQARRDLHRRRVPAVGDQHEGVAQQVEAACRVDEAFPLQRVHPAGIGGNEDVRRRAVPDLAGERGGAGKRDRDGMAGLPLEPGGDLVHRVLQAGRGEHRKPVRAEAGRGEAQDERKAGGEPKQAAADGRNRQGRRSPAVGAFARSGQLARFRRPGKDPL